MHGHEKSDPEIVAIRTDAGGMRREKPTNKAAPAAAELVERRAGTKGNAGQQSTLRAQDRAGVSQALDRIRQAARHNKKERFTALLHHINPETLRLAFDALKKDAAPGVDGVTWSDYEVDLERKLEALHDRVHRGAYRPQPSRRVYIPKADGRQRPLAVAAVEDKIVQGAVAMVLSAIYEVDFLGFSYGFRPGRGQHDALDALVVGISSRKVNWILDADVRSFLDGASDYPPIPGETAKRSALASGTLIRKPFRRPCRIWTACSSPRFTRCRTVWRDTPSCFVASIMGMKPGGVFSTKRLSRSSVMRISQGAPGVGCSAGMKPSSIQRSTVPGAKLSTSAALRTVTDSPFGVSDGGFRQGMPR